MVKYCPIESYRIRRGLINLYDEYNKDLPYHNINHAKQCLDIAEKNIDNLYEFIRLTDRKARKYYDANKTSIIQGLYCGVAGHDVYYIPGCKTNEYTAADITVAFLTVNGVLDYHTLAVADTVIRYGTDHTLTPDQMKSKIESRLRDQYGLINREVDNIVVTLANYVHDIDLMSISDVYQFNTNAHLIYEENKMLLTRMRVAGEINSETPLLTAYHKNRVAFFKDLMAKNSECIYRLPIFSHLNRLARGNIVEYIKTHS